MSSSCIRIKSCPLFRTFSIKSSLRVWQSYYCEADFARCERWKLSQAGRAVAINLLPNGRMLEVPLDQLEPKDLV